MNTKLNKVQMDYLYNNLLKDRIDLWSEIEVNKTGNYFWLKLNNLIASEIKDWTNLQLQLKGFDANYELTKEGEVLDELMNIFLERRRQQDSYGRLLDMWKTDFSKLTSIPSHYLTFFSLSHFENVGL